jgi:hypothetical protein
MELHDDLLVNIFQYIDLIYGLSNYKLVCKHWNALTSIGYLWNNYYFTTTIKNVIINKNKNIDIYCNQYKMLKSIMPLYPKIIFPATSNQIKTIVMFIEEYKTMIEYIRKEYDNILSYIDDVIYRNEIDIFEMYDDPDRK